MSAKVGSRQSTESGVFSSAQTRSTSREEVTDQEFEEFIRAMSADGDKKKDHDETGSQISTIRESSQIREANDNSNKEKETQEMTKPLSRDRQQNSFLSPIPSTEREYDQSEDSQSLGESRGSPTNTEASQQKETELQQRAPWDYFPPKEQSTPQKKPATNQSSPRSILPPSFPGGDTENPSYAPSESISPNNSARFDGRQGLGTLAPSNASSRSTSPRSPATSLKTGQQKGLSASKTSMASLKAAKTPKNSAASKAHVGKNNNSKIERLSSRDKLPQLAQEAEAQMDKCQRDVLRRKRPLIADTLDFSPEMQKIYREHGILRPAMLAEILGEKTDYAKMFKFLELIPIFGAAGFDALCDIFQEVDQSWLSDELYSDLLAERGDLEIEEYIYREAGVLVHKQFGGSKRVSEVEKKEIQLLMSVRYQSAKEAYKRQLAKTQKELDSACNFKYAENGRMKEILKKIRTFLRVQRPRINEHAHTVETALDFLRDDPDPECRLHDYFRMVDGDVDGLLELLARVLLEKETLEEERKRCLRVLRLDKPVLRLDAVLEDALRRAAEQMTKSQNDANMNEQIATSLDSQMKNLQVVTDKEMAAKDRHLMYLEQLARNREEKIYQMDRLTLGLRQRCDAAEDDAEKWRRRCEMVEKTRRLGYYYPKWFDELYEIEDLEYARNRGDKKLVSMGPLSRSADNISPRKMKGPVKLRKSPMNSGKRDAAETGSENGQVRISYQSSMNV